jgi:hypothetical protein
MKMKALTRKSSIKLLAALAFIFLPICLNAQGDEAKKQFDDVDCSRNRGITGSNFSIVLSATQVHSGVGVLFGGRGAFIFNEALTAGMAFNMLPMRRVDCPMPDHDGRHHLLGIYGGFFIGRTPFSINSLRVAGDMLIGLGGMTWYRPGDAAFYDEFGTVIRPGTGFRHPRSPVFMVLEPRISVELLGNEEAALSLAISYRYCPFFRLQYEGVDVIPRTAFNGLTVSLVFTVNAAR